MNRHERLISEAIEQIFDLVAGQQRSFVCVDIGVVTADGRDRLQISPNVRVVRRSVLWIGVVACSED
ncbi:hypothetical protein [Nocardia abscessus]|uniref:hypothetical protein n=1 Tax=Nocardia abscessus TaxID=120957 RepID=UPI003CC7DD69